MTRAGARPGDDIWISGALGDAAVWRREKTRNPATQTPFPMPRARLALGARLAARATASAAMDISDGALATARAVCEASGAAAQIEIDKLPPGRLWRKAARAKSVARFATVARFERHFYAARSSAAATNTNCFFARRRRNGARFWRRRAARKQRSRASGESSPGAACRFSSMGEKSTQAKRAGRTDMSTTSADSRFVFANGWRLAAFGGGLGLVPKAPGTAGSAAAALFFALLQRGFGMQDAAAAAIAVLLIAVGFVICEKASRDLGGKDDPGIVWDEIAAMFALLAALSLFFDSPLRWSVWTQAFVLFRIFDALKPPPIRQIDRKMKGGAGIMADDLAAAAAAGIIVWAIEFFARAL